MRKLMLVAASAVAMLSLQGAYDDLHEVESRKAATDFWDVSEHPAVETTVSAPYATALDAQAYSSGADTYAAFDLLSRFAALSNGFDFDSRAPGWVLFLK